MRFVKLDLTLTAPVKRRYSHVDIPGCFCVILEDNTLGITGNDVALFKDHDRVQHFRHMLAAYADEFYEGGRDCATLCVYRREDTAAPPGLYIVRNALLWSDAERTRH